MKLRIYLISLISALFLLSLTSFAQDEKMSEDEWEDEMARLRDKKASLMNEINALQNEVNNLKSTSLQSFEDCISELYALVGATKADIDNFRKAVNELDGKIRRKEGPKADRQKDLNALKMNKISALPEFFDKVHSQMQRSLDSWVEEEAVTMYTVVRGDHLWGIARKPEHYGNGFAWPMIYRANRDKIKNPDLIYPKQVFSIPKLTEEEKAKYDKIRKNYKPAPVQ